MKNKYIIISISIILSIILLTITINKSSKEYIMQDGIMLALTLDGEKINTYPEGTNYEVEINCENGKGKWLVDEWKLAVEEITGNVVCNIDFISNPKTLVTEVERKATTNTNGFRYSGTNPDNYIWFNNELWRIIGSIPTCLSASCGTNTTNLVKIIRNQAIGSLAYDAKSSGYSGIWGDNTLYKLLNNYYYGAMDATSSDYCYVYQNSSKSKCDYTTIGINETSYYGKMIKNIYWNTGAINGGTDSSTAYNYEVGTQTVSGYIGLMNSSDYGYAANSSYHNTTLSSYGTTEITITNWLFSQGREWTNIYYSYKNTYVRTVFNYGIVDNVYVYEGSKVRPVVYLDPSVYIVSGDGSITNPYQIGM